MASVVWDQKVQDSNHYRYKKIPGLLGVEIEAEGNRLPAAVFGWDVHKEGSLRGEAKEYVTIGAVTFEELEESMELLQQALKQNGAVVDEASYRASTHIHVNMQRKTHREVVHSIIAFLLVEPMWMRLCGPTRDGNLFCLPSYDCGDMAEFLSSYVESIEKYGNIGAVDQRGKYASLNTMPLTGFGTLEFRTFPCSVNLDKVMAWAHWCNNIVEAGSRIKDPMRTLTAFYDNPKGLMYEVFGPQLVDMFNPVEVNEMVELGAENAYEAIRSYQDSLLKAPVVNPEKEAAIKAKKKNMEEAGMVWNPIVKRWVPRDDLRVRVANPFDEIVPVPEPRW